jgi:hypothetical protein
MSPKFQKWSALKFAGRIIPITEFIGISDTDIRKRSVSELASRTIPEAKRKFTHFYELINDERIFLKTSGLILISPVNG